MNQSVRFLALLTAAFLACPSSQAADTPVLDIGSRRQLFVDDFLIAQKTNVRLALHQPVRREVVLTNEHPWEKHGVSYMVTFRDGGLFRAWYRCDGKALDDRRSMTAYAESKDGVHWKKPELGIVDWNGSTKNNLVWAGPGRNMAPFKDTNPATPAAERYKAIVVDARGLLALVSPDGLRWRLLYKEPILTEGPFDSHNIAFWDEWAGQYMAYTRGVRREGQIGEGMTKGFRNGVRWIRRATSKDFKHWTPLEPIDTGAAPLEHFYTNATVPYERSPGLYLMFPSRFADAREPKPGWKAGKGVNDSVLLSSRDGLRFQRTFLEAFVRPGLDPGNWHERSLYLERGLLQTAPQELSLYAMENWRLDTNHIRRLTLRPDGFVSVQAPYAGGELITRPVRFSGKRLWLNFSTSAVGSLQVEIQDAKGKPLAGFSLQDCPLIYGDELDRPVRWQSGPDLGKLAGTPIRLRFLMRDADLYAFRFGDE